MKPHVGLVAKRRVEVRSSLGDLLGHYTLPEPISERGQQTRWSVAVPTTEPVIGALLDPLAQSTYVELTFEVKRYLREEYDGAGDLVAISAYAALCPTVATELEARLWRRIPRFEPTPLYRKAFPVQ